MKNTNYKIPYVNLGKQHNFYIKPFQASLKKFLKSGQFILGEHVREFEKNFSKYIGTKFAIGVGSGTDALYLSLKYLNLKKNDEVITVANSYLSTVSVIHLVGARPVLVDVNYNDYNIDVKKIEKKITKNTKVILPVHLCGVPAKMNIIRKIAKKYNLRIIEDCAQATGASIGKKKVGTFGFSGCYSFHPLKTLNAIGDGGMIVTNNKRFYKWLIRARNNGHPSRDLCDFWSHNMRLDALHAMFLNKKLKNYERVISKRNRNVNLYRSKLDKNIVLQEVNKNCKSVYQTFIVKTKKRKKLINFLKSKKIEAKIHYPIPIHKLKAFKNTNKKFFFLPITEKLSKEIITLPAMEYLSEKQISYIIKKINVFFKKEKKKRKKKWS